MEPNTFELRGVSHRLPNASDFNEMRPWLRSREHERRRREPRQLAEQGKGRGPDVPIGTAGLAVGQGGNASREVQLVPLKA